MAARKTIEVRPLIETLNTAIKSSEHSKAREALCFVAEKVLMDTNNYRGFRYNTPYESKESEPGFDDYNRHYHPPVGRI